MHKECPQSYDKFGAATRHLFSLPTKNLQGVASTPLAGLGISQLLGLVEVTYVFVITVMLDR